MKIDFSVTELNKKDFQVDSTRARRCAADSVGMWRVSFFSYSFRAEGVFRS